MNYMGLFDPIYWALMLPAMLFALYAQTALKSTYAKYSRIGNQNRITGAEAARRVLQAGGIPVVRVGMNDGSANGVRIEQVGGFLSDHYDPRTRTLRLSPDIYQGGSIAAIGVAAHEAGHAIQHAQHYFPLKLRSLAVPVAGFGSMAAVPLIILGAIISSAGLIQFGIIMFTLVVVFQIITLPVEFDASSRAKQLLSTTGITMNAAEDVGVRKVLSAAAMTYVAATVSSIMQLLYLVLRFGNSRN